MPFLAKNSASEAIKPAAAVTLAGGILKNKSSDTETKKYPRKDCPVCKGNGWYMSGDNIKKIECQYCEPNKEEPPTEPEQEPELTEKDPPKLVPIKPEEIESQKRRILIHRR